MHADSCANFQEQKHCLVGKSRGLPRGSQVKMTKTWPKSSITRPYGFIGALLATSRNFLYSFEIRKSFRYFSQKPQRPPQDPQKFSKKPKDPKQILPSNLHLPSPPTKTLMPILKTSTDEKLPSQQEFPAAPTWTPCWRHTTRPLYELYKSHKVLLEAV